MRRYILTSVVLLATATGFSMWRENCHTGCQFVQVVFGWPVFLRTPYAPESTTRPEFQLIPLLLNIAWSSLGSLIFWMLFDTFARWQDRQSRTDISKDIA